MSVESKVKNAIRGCQSGSITLHQITENGSERSLSNQSLLEVLSGLNAPKGLQINQDKGEVIPCTAKEWDWLESVTKNPTVKIKVNGQKEAYALTLFKGVFSDGTPASQMRNWKNIRREQAQTELACELAGYGKSRMGGWVES